MFGLLHVKVWASIIGAGVIAAAGWFVVHTIERAALAEAETEGYRVALTHQNEAVRDYERRLQAHQARVQEIDRELSTWKRKWKEIQSQPVVVEWVNTPIPAPVRDRLLELVTPPGGSGADGGAFYESDALAGLF